jgi:nicotinic acid mononucleotide adenylyltransferase
MGQMKKYRQLVKELPSKSVVFAFGRFNPPTTGHELLFKVVQKLAKSHNADHVIYASRTQDKKKNPLSVDRKIHFLKLMFKNVTFAAANDNERTFLEVAKNLNKKYKNLIMVAGSDRVSEMEATLNKYNGKEYKFDTIQVVSAGERDPDADDAAGMSASKMRAIAAKGDYISFKKGLPSTVRDIDGRRLMNEIRQAMGLDPIKEDVKFSIDVLREKYFKGEIYHIGDLVESAGQQYEIMDRGSNYLVVVDESGNLHRKWIKDVNMVEIKNFKEFSEDIQPGPAPKEISYKGYTTKNLHHSADATKAFQSTIQRTDSGLVHDPVAVLNALKATDAYMKLNDMHLEQGKAPDSAEVQEWIYAHDLAKKALEKIGEFPHHQDYWNTHKTELQFMGNDFKNTGKAEFNEELTNKTVKPNDKVKVARILADMLGVEKAENTSNPEQLINAGLRKLRTKQINKDLLNVVHKMLNLADEVGIKYDATLKPNKLKEDKDNQVVVDKNSTYNAANSILNYSDYLKLKKMNKGVVEADTSITTDEDDMDPNDEDDMKHTSATKIASKKLEKQDAPRTTPGHMYSTNANDDQLRRRKVRYATEEVIEEDQWTADYSTSKDGKKHRAHRISFKNSNMNAKPDATPNEDEDEKEYKKGIKVESATVKVGKVAPIKAAQLGNVNSKGFDAFFEENDDLEDDELEKMAKDVHDDEIIDCCYDDDELVTIDPDTGEELKEEFEESQELIEVLSKIERMRAKTRFARSKSKRQRRTAIALKKHSPAPVINSRARRLAISLLKKRIARKPLSKLSVGEKERIEAMLARRKQLINRLAMRLVSRVRQVEKARLSHSKYTAGKPAVGF